MSRVIGILSFWWLLLPIGALQAADLPAPVILVFGDSISAGYGIAPESGWVNLLSSRLRQEGYGFQVVNASVSGETTVGGLARLPRALAAHDPRIVIIELGGNDGLRGLPLAGTRANLGAMLGLAARHGRSVLLLGLRMPPNYGERYTRGFAAIYTALAPARHVPLVPFLSAGIAEQPSLMQSDGLHPNERGQPVLLDNVWPVLKPLLHKQPH
jgi:acyl-CoA thioesterase-1